MQLQNTFIHHVFFYLHNNNAGNVQSLVEGLQRLSAAKNIKQFHIGIPANTNRDVVERSYSVSWMILFDNAEDQENYQHDPVHLKFIEECSYLWSKVVVYDCINA